MQSINKEKLLALRDGLYWEHGEVPPLEDTSIAHLGGTKLPKPLGFIPEVSYQWQLLGRMDSLGFWSEDLELLRKQTFGWSAEWVCRLATEVWELANLSSLEITSAKCLTDQLAKEKCDLNDKSRFLRMLCESSRAEVLQMKARIMEKEHLEVELVSVSNTNSIVEAGYKISVGNGKNGDHS